MESVKRQTKRITYLSGTTLGTRSEKLTFENGFEVSNGFSVLINSNTSNAIFRIGIQKDGVQVEQLVNAKLFLVNENTPAGKRFTPIEIPADGKQIKIQIELISDLTADLDFDVVFNLKRKADADA